METRTETKYLGVRMPAELRRQMEEAARKQDRTVSSWLREQVRDALAEDGEQTRREKRQQTDN